MIYECGLRLLEGPGCRSRKSTAPGWSSTFTAKESRTATSRSRPAVADAARLLAHPSLADMAVPGADTAWRRHRLTHNGGPVTRSSLQSAFRRAVKRSGVTKAAHVHTLRIRTRPRYHPMPDTLRLMTLFIILDALSPLTLPLVRSTRLLRTPNATSVPGFSPTSDCVAAPRDTNP